MRTIAAVVATVFGGALIAGVVPATFAQSKSAPAEQKAFVKAAVDAEKKFQSGINDKRAAEAYDERKAAICKAIGSGSFVGWIGTVAALGDAEGGRKSIEIAIWLDVSLGTGLGINSGPASGGLVDPGTPIFDDVSRLNLGDVVTFSGAIIRGANDNCAFERSASLRDSMMTPSFAIKLRTIRETDAQDESVISGVADRMKALRRDEMNLWAIRGTSPDKYLAILKKDNLPLWLDEAEVMSPSLYKVYLAELAVKDPGQFMDFGWRWDKDEGFGFALIVSFQVTSHLAYPVKDLLVRCVGYGASGTAIAHFSETIYEVFAPKKQKTINELNLGFRDKQIAKIGCRVADVKRL